MAAEGRDDNAYAKLTSNELAFGPLPEAQAAVAEALPRANRYPDSHVSRLRRAIADANSGTEPANVLVGNGSSEVLMNALQLLPRGGEVLFPWPSFSLYPMVCAVLGMKARPVPLTKDHGIPARDLLSAVTDETRAVIVCNPNNPTGTYLGPEEVREMAAELPSDVLLGPGRGLRRVRRGSVLPGLTRAGAREGEHRRGPNLLEGARACGPENGVRDRLAEDRRLRRTRALPGLREPGGPDRGYGLDAGAR
jgi:hypothetical protein